MRYYVKRSQGEDFEEVRTPSDAVRWVSVENANQNDVSVLSHRYDLDAAILADVLDASELPRTEFSNNNEYVFMRNIRLTKRGGIETSPILMVLSGARFFIVAKAEINLPMPYVARNVTLDETSSAGLLLGTFTAAVGRYEELIGHTDKVIRGTSHRLKTHEVTNRDFVHFVTVEENLNHYQINLEAMQSIARRLRENQHDLFEKRDLEFIDDIILHIGQLIVSVTTSFKRVESIRNAYSTIANNNLNERMKMLTALTVIVALPNVFYGMYGMNVVLPFADQPWAYGAVVGFTVILMFGVYLLAKRFRIF